ncbi:MAG: putative hydrolase of the superfamily [Frankiales bacterium]|nr:putative hydrolase of the superfamily [Frankiales bacterium]
MFDLDDTLYLERDYVRSGFAAVGEYLREHHGLPDAGDRAWAYFVQGRRGDTFNQVLQDAGIAPTHLIIHELIRVYRTHQPDIALLPDAAAAIDRLRPDYRIAVITDGPIESQSAKARALHVGDYADPLILTAALGEGFGKPHARAFEIVMERVGLAADAFAYVADNPAKDFAAPRGLGWRTIRVNRPESLHTNVDSGAYVDVEIPDLSTLLNHLGAR